MILFLSPFNLSRPGFSGKMTFPRSYDLEQLICLRSHTQTFPQRKPMLIWFRNWVYKEQLVIFPWCVLSSDLNDECNKGKAVKVKGSIFARARRRKSERQLREIVTHTSG